MEYIIRSIFLTFFCLILTGINKVYAQSPGGVFLPTFLDKGRWYNASNTGSITLSGTKVTGWSDISGNTGSFPASASPSTISVNNQDTFNFNPTIHFDGNSYLKGGTDFPMWFVQDIYVVYSADVYTTFSTLIDETSSSTYRNSLVLNGSGTLRVQGNYNGTGYNLAGPTGLAPVKVPALAWVRYCGNGCGTNSNRVSTNLNTLYYGSLASYSGAPNPNVSAIGGPSGSSSLSTYNKLVGNVSEIVSFSYFSISDTISVLSRSKIASYLALKYGITISDDYVSSQGAIFFNVATTSPQQNTGLTVGGVTGVNLTNNIFGIGTDNNGSGTSGLTQAVSHSSATIGTSAPILTVATSNDFSSQNAGRTGISNNQFMMFGDNNGSTAGFSSTSIVPGYKTLPRVWTSQNTGGAGAINMQFNLSGTSGINGAPVYLVTSSSSTMSNPTFTLLNNTSNSLYTTTAPFSFNNQTFFTLTLGATIQVNKVIVGNRIDPSDQFTTLIYADSITGSTLSNTGIFPGGGAITTGTNDTALAAAALKTIGSTLKITESNSGPSALSAYTTTITCTNAAQGSSTLLPSGTFNPSTGANITPASGDNVVCTITNLIMPLSIKLVSFNGILQEDNGVQLEWVVNNENNLDRYEIQLSNNGTEFSTVGFSPALNTVAMHSYSYNYTLSTGNTNFFRLKIVDNNNVTSYSRTLAINRNVSGPNITIYPMPTSVGEGINIELSGFNGSPIARLYNTYGQTVINEFLLHNGSNVISILGLSPGIYYVEIIDKLTKLMNYRKMIIQ